MSEKGRIVGIAKKSSRRPPPGAGPDAGPVSAPNVWAEPRSLFFFRTGRLAGPQGEAVCEIVALAESGAVIRSDSAYAPGESCELELNSLHRLRASIAWTDGTHFGLEFPDRPRVREVIAGRQTSFPYRPPRLRVSSTLEISLGSKRLKVRSHDISEAGIKVELAAQCEGEDAVVALEGLGQMHGRVRWWRDGCAGISFRRPIPAEKFTRWVTARLEALAR